VTTTAPNDNLISLADARLAREYRDRYRRLLAIARGFDWLSAEDCEDLANDTLIDWYCALRTGGGVEFDDTFCGMVLRREATSRLRRHITARSHTVDLSEADEIGVDPQLDAALAEQEEAQQLAALARRVLSADELRIVWLRACGYDTREISRQMGISWRELRTALQRVRRKVRLAIELNHQQTG
jgi:RNA polymerase sigma factor (sigma-70 family)